MTWQIFSTCCKRRGLTLIEVVAAIAILSVLLTAILMSYRSHVLQIHAAKERLTAIELADQLLTQWVLASSVPNVGEQGQTSDESGICWRIVEVDSKNNTCFDFQIVRLELYMQDRQDNKEVLAWVDVLTSSSVGEP